MSGALIEQDRKVLAVLVERYYDEGEWGAYRFSTIQTSTGLDRRTVRLSCRRLARKGFAQFEKGLWTEDGEPAGAGYRATAAGAELILLKEKAA